MKNKLKTIKRKQVFKSKNILNVLLLPFLNSEAIFFLTLIQNYNTSLKLSYTKITKIKLIIIEI